MATVAPTRATLDDLYRTPEKAELIGGRIVIFMSTGRKPGRVGGRIYRSLDDYAAQHGGEAFPDNVSSRRDGGSGAGGAGVDRGGGLDFCVRWEKRGPG